MFPKPDEKISVETRVILLCKTGSYLIILIFINTSETVAFGAILSVLNV